LNGSTFMDLNAFLNLLPATGLPVLPAPGTMRLALHGAWAIVLGCGALLVAGRLTRPYRWGLAALAMAWTLWPGPASPAYWLGLAFQAPSMMTAVMGLGWLVDHARRAPGVGSVPVQPGGPALKILAAAGVVLGWILLLDTLAWLPVSVYAWGFGSVTFAAAVLFTLLLWLLGDAALGCRNAPGRMVFCVPLSVLALFALTRWPTGNLWDALIDPWLWVALQLGWLISAARRLARRPPAATRA
jgi:hypothetical protein